MAEMNSEGASPTTDKVRCRCTAQGGGVYDAGCPLHAGEQERLTAEQRAEYERMPRPPEGFAACRVGSGPQITHLVILDSTGSNGGRPTLCRLTRFPTRGADGEVLLAADLPGWSMGGGVEGRDVRQIECDDCYDRLDRIIDARTTSPDKA